MEDVNNEALLFPLMAGFLKHVGQRSHFFCQENLETMHLEKGELFSCRVTAWACLRKLQGVNLIKKWCCLFVDLIIACLIQWAEIQRILFFFIYHIQRDWAILADSLDFHTCIVKATSTVDDPSQPPHRLVTFLPSGRSYISSRATTTTGFIPEAVSLLNTLLLANACLTQHDPDSLRCTKLHHTLFY